MHHSTAVPRMTRFADGLGGPKVPRFRWSEPLAAASASLVSYVRAAVQPSSHRVCNGRQQELHEAGSPYRTTHPLSPDSAVSAQDIPTFRTRSGSRIGNFLFWANFEAAESAARKDLQPPSWRADVDVTKTQPVLASMHRVLKTFGLGASLLSLFLGLHRGPA